MTTKELRALIEEARKMLSCFVRQEKWYGKLDCMGAHEVDELIPNLIKALQQVAKEIKCDYEEQLGMTLVVCRGGFRYSYEQDQEGFYFRRLNGKCPTCKGKGGKYDV